MICLVDLVAAPSDVTARLPPVLSFDGSAVCALSCRAACCPHSSLIFFNLEGKEQPPVEKILVDEILCQFRNKAVYSDFNLRLAIFVVYYDKSAVSGISKNQLSPSSGIPLIYYLAYGEDKMQKKINNSLDSGRAPCYARPSQKGL